MQPVSSSISVRQSEVTLLTFLIKALIGRDIILMQVNRAVNVMVILVIGRLRMELMGNITKTLLQEII